MTTIARLVDGAAQRFGDRIAVVDGDRHLTFREVGDRSNRLANALLGLSSSSGSRVALLLSNRLEFIEADFAIAKAGKVKAPINLRLSDEERQFILANCTAEILITESNEIDRVESIRGDLPMLKHIVSVNGGGIGYENLLAQSSPAKPNVNVDPCEASMILHTSGTTGRPKGATTSHQARIAATSNMLLDEFLADEHDGMIHVASMSHGSGSKILAYFVRGAKNITIAKFEPDAFFEAVESGGGTSSFVVPTMIRMLLDAPNRTNYDLSGIRNITYGGAPISVTLAEEALTAFGPVLTQVYGSCEAPHPVTVLSNNDYMVGNYDHLSSAGHETFGVEVRIADGAGNELPINQPGELQVRGSNVMMGYWNDEVATQGVFVDGWYRSGDIARRSEDGFIYIMGREREMLISGGLNVYPAEVEAVLMLHPAISEAAVFGIPDERWGESVVAVLVVRQGQAVNESQIVDYCTAHLASYKKPRRIVFVETLPKGGTGKIAKGELKTMVLSANLGSVSSSAPSSSSALMGHN